MKSKYLITSVLLCCSVCLRASDIVWYNGTGHVTYQVVGKCSPVVDIALDMFSNDMKAVTGKKANSHHSGTIQVFQLDQLDNKSFKALEKTGLPYQKIITREDAFYIGTYQGKIGIVGSNGRGFWNCHGLQAFRPGVGGETSDQHTRIASPSNKDLFPCNGLP